MAKAELQLQKGEANNALCELQLSLQDEKTFMEEKNCKSNHNVGSKQATHSWDSIKAASKRVEKHQQKYNACWKAMLVLGLSESNPVFQLIHDQNVFVKNTLEFHQLGDRKKTDSWLWGAEDLASLLEAEWSDLAVDCNQVQWFQAHANMQWWQEEVEILSEELWHAICRFKKWALVWNQLAESSGEL
uniref:Uncharacterized protein n=1 Tax=Moniliophthora roreri TaxID=221103 RepID=A0A0W0FXD6_MONRR